MIVPQTALKLIGRHARPLGTVRVALADALDHVLAEDVRSPLALPLFDNSAMDGYALRARDTAHATPSRPARLTVRATVYAGDTVRRTIRKDEACGIMTGAPLPRGADTVIPIEQAVVDGSTLVVERDVSRHRHVRRKGEELGKGAQVLERGDIIHPGSIACLATVGRRAVRVVRQPAVSIITTGDETVAPGQRLEHGQIYDSNSYMIEAQLRDMGLEPVRIRRVGDRASALARSVAAALEVSDVVIVVGGVSVGDRDYLRDVLRRQGVRQIFWRVRQKPGKPLYFGVRGRRLVFGLPGNPASAFTCFYIYVYPALRRLAGHKDATLAHRDRVTDGVVTDRSKWRFLKSTTGSDGVAVATERQGSHMITSLARANGLIAVPPGGGKTSGRMTTYRLPYAEDDE